MSDYRLLLMGTALHPGAFLALVIPGITRARNTPGTGPYRKCQPLKKISTDQMNHKNLTPQNLHFEHENFPIYSTDSAIAQVCYSGCCQFCSPFLAATDRLITLLSTVYQGEQAKIVLLLCPGALCKWADMS